VKDNVNKPALRKISFASQSDSLETPDPGPSDPTQLGAVLHVANQAGTDDLLVVLPPAGWKGLGKPAGARGYRYSDLHRRFGPCTVVTVVPGKKATATCSGAQIPFTLDELAQESVSISLTLGDSATQCMEFGGTVQADRPATAKKGGAFEAKNAPPPASCPAF
jgi:hypothetical protein